MKKYTIENYFGGEREDEILYADSYKDAVNFWSNDDNLTSLEMNNEPDEIAYFEEY